MKKWLTLFAFSIFMMSWMVPALVQAAPAKTIMYFWGNSCPHCHEIAPVIDGMIARGVPIEKYEIYANRENADRLMMLFKMYGIPEQERGVPVAFYDGRIYMGVDRIRALDKELADSPEGGAAGSLGTSETIAIVGAALADSVNPCAILVLVILLSFVSLYHESRKRLILSAASFILSVFVTYLMLGIGIVQAVHYFGVAIWLRNFIGVVAIVVGLVNIKDYFSYGAGGFVSEIPRSWRPLLFQILRKATNPIAAFVAGALVTLIELPCTGGPYLFALGILSKWGMTPMFFGYLLLYNLIFVSPLILTSVLIYLGKLSVEKASDWQARNSQRMHLAAGLFMLAAGIAVFWT